ncbi:hypothetical protein, partial [Caballeronia arvi]|uniref:hypothetical protein n=1 Tax=Caballeronia arvi TaxID=1777135 RepID=UPI001F34E4CA
GIGVRFAVEFVFALPWNSRSFCRGIFSRLIDNTARILAGLVGSALLRQIRREIRQHLARPKRTSIFCIKEPR